MSLLDRYVLRQLAGAFALVLGILTPVVWLTSSLRQLDLLVAQSQTILVFIGITALALPLLVLLITPFALFIAFLFVLTKLNADSELIVMSASGLSPGRLLRPMATLTLAVTCAAWAMSIVIVPAALRELRESATAARADFLGQVVQPGRFTTVDQGLTFHVRDRGSNGVLLGVFVNDTRDPELDMTYFGARGVIFRNEQGAFLVLEDGQIMRKPKRGSGFGSVISFESYAFILSAFAGAATVTDFPAQERWIGDLVTMASDRALEPRAAARAFTELHERLSGPLYVPAFVLVAVVALGRARTTRQSRTESVFLAIVAIVLLRVGGFFASSLAQREPLAVLLMYALPLAAIAVGLALVVGEWPRLRRFTQRALDALPRLPKWPRALKAAG
jgi:lipopolysaccharide export system permease protein